MLITVMLPSGGTASLGIGDDVLVFNGQEFKDPKNLRYVELYGLPVNAKSMPFEGFPSQTLSAAVRIRAKVISIDADTVADTDPSLVTRTDPSGGQCICGLTCNGTDIRFAVVQLEN